MKKKTYVTPVVEICALPQGQLLQSSSVTGPIEFDIHDDNVLDDENPTVGYWQL